MGIFITGRDTAALARKSAVQLLSTEEPSELDTDRIPYCSTVPI